MHVVCADIIIISSQFLWNLTKLLSPPSRCSPDAAVLRQSLSLLDYHFLQEKPLHPLSRLYAERISNYLSSNNEQSKFK
ncbi:uncharacterized protein LOC113467364 isoform X3 [Diaphorina citri]|uniref:Uncharacterized protein LOC113467364 isoform X3 n=1 Tax=Diaphorina citri TaxID=121845 RepID=A0A3Q0IX85_DIACI|nr:uncharacterized protein LOC113467364 isoform X3 [Diaphorina citri]